MKAKLENLIKEYGMIAMIVYLIIFLIVALGFIGAVQLGISTEEVPGGILSLLGATWVFLKVTQVGRIALTLIPTPIVARFLPRGKTNNSPT